VKSVEQVDPATVDLLTLLVSAGRPRNCDSGFPVGSFPSPLGPGPTPSARMGGPPVGDISALLPLQDLSYFCGAGRCHTVFSAYWTGSSTPARRGSSFNLAGLAGTTSFYP
jgi:hypothetical protein